MFQEAQEGQGRTFKATSTARHSTSCQLTDKYIITERFFDVYGMFLGVHGTVGCVRYLLQRDLCWARRGSHLVEDYAKCNDLLGIGRRDINESDSRKKSSKIIIYIKYM